MPTIAQGQLLTTGGEIRVRAYKGPDELVLKPNKRYHCTMPSGTAVPDPLMSIFYGKDMGTYTDWMDNASSVSTNTGIDSLELIATDSAAHNYIMDIPVMGWINCDYFNSINSQPHTNITFSSTVDDLTNVVEFLYFPGIHSVMQVYNNVSGNIPIGIHVKALCFAQNSSNTMSYYLEDITSVASGQSVTVVMTNISDSALITAMNGL